MLKKAEFAAAVVEKSGVKISENDAKKVVDAVIGVIADELKAGEKVTFNGFGTFDVVDKPERTARNPRTGENMTVAACKAPKFKASKALKDAVNA